jgi:hypothetical protein
MTMKRNNRANGLRKPRCDSYHAQLSETEREQIYQWLLEPGLSVDEVVRRAPPWRSGKRAGQPPGEEAVAKIGRKVRVESALAEVEAIAAVQHAALARMLARVPQIPFHEELVNGVMATLGQNVVRDTVQHLDPEARTEAAKLLLTRSDQLLEQKKFDWLVHKFEEETHALKLKEEQALQSDPQHRGVPAEVLAEIEKELRLL